MLLTNAKARLARGLDRSMSVCLECAGAGPLRFMGDTYVVRTVLAVGESGRQGIKMPTASHWTACSRKQYGHERAMEEDLPSALSLQGTYILDNGLADLHDGIGRLIQSFRSPDPLEKNAGGGTASGLRQVISARSVSAVPHASSHFYDGCAAVMEG